MCRYFDCQVGDIFEYQPHGTNQSL
ncbi:hypothetical protein GPM19_07080 [Halomonas sp. ZH2S]|uniref:HTH cro/C1-type domain-containing protein n=1 Tax=Vreelandella zhuhanensis TaxID=2684210 RepID=A0A7X3H1U4_9GAMM|nr:hypothetical protein [Halomonas zhuhanensis]